MTLQKAFCCLAVVTLAVSGSSCAAIQALLTGSVKKPTLTFKSASLANVSLGDATINLNYRLDNPNPFGLSLATVQYELLVEGHQVVAGQPPNGLTIPASGSADVVLPANVKFAEVAPVLETFLTKDEAAYTAKGAFGVETPIGIITLPIEHSGTFPVPKLPTVELQPPQLAEVTLTSATLQLPLVVTNRNAFPIPISGVSGAVSVGGSRVGTVSSPDIGAIGPQSTVPVMLPVRLDFAQAATAVMALQRPGGAMVVFDAEIRSGPAKFPVHLQQNVRAGR
ncbi:MAG TPA: LEA type 2 family protein [Myxococcaceae bacterium]|nr:LEA type 2 family protein [Myxococcaceae bacterium]